ncbi:hypothetical protein R3P38DRAFT_2761579 [Favolaschia claudopus]|uniref:Uncharacterized protein n=1 Tax=Favolaschia claudopus TaxID=2862362 RepID=A0AAW0DQK3_9AGAR
MNAFPSLALLPGMAAPQVALPIAGVAVVALPLGILPCYGNVALLAPQVYGAPAFAAPAAPQLPPAPPAPAPSKKEKEVSTKEAPKAQPGAGLPAALVALLRREAPFRANEVFSVVPTEPLVAVEEETAAPEWYAIMRGRFVGVVDQYLLSDFAITGVARGARKAYDTQANALRAFNQALTWGGVEIL